MGNRQIEVTLSRDLGRFVVTMTGVGAMIRSFLREALLAPATNDKGGRDSRNTEPLGDLPEKQRS
ncbi:MAG: hypothetical protein OES12_07390 [Anaerolineae bacterium]|nr:hypothetical protein [Anaerolineae bacterium]